MKVLGIAGDKFAPDPMLDSMCKTISKLMDVPIAGSPPIALLQPTPANL